LLRNTAAVVDDARLAPFAVNVSLVSNRRWWPAHAARLV